MDAGDTIDLGVGLAALAPATAEAQRGAEILLNVLTNPDQWWLRQGFAQVVGDLAHGCPRPRQLANQILDRIAEPELEPAVAYHLADASTASVSSCPQPQEVADRVLEAMTNPNPSRMDTVAKLAEALAALAPGSPQAKRGAEILLERLTNPNLDAGYAHGSRRW